MFKAYLAKKKREDIKRNQAGYLTFLKQRGVQVGLPFAIGFALIGTLFLSFAASAADDSTNSVFASEIPRQPGNVDTPLEQYGDPFEGKIRVETHGISVFKKNLDSSFPVEVPACNTPNGRPDNKPIIHEVYLQWYQRWRGNNTSGGNIGLPNFDQDITISVNGGAPISHEIASDSAAWARLYGGPGQTYFRRNALVKITNQFDASWQSDGANIISFTNLTNPTGSNQVSAETYGVGAHIFYECPEFDEVLIKFSNGLDWFYNLTSPPDRDFRQPYIGKYSDLSCTTFPAASQRTLIKVDAILGGQKNLGPNNLRGAVLYYLAGSGPLPTDDSTLDNGPAGIVAQDPNRKALGSENLNALDRDAIWKSSLGQEWDEYNNYKNYPAAELLLHQIQINPGDTWLCLQAESINNGGQQGISGDLFSVAFSIPVLTTTQPITDWGDLPDSIPGSVDYNTDKTGIEGPSHPITSALQIGAELDDEDDGQPTALANGDDNNPTTVDDEDGVITPTIEVGQANNFTVTVSNSMGQDAYLYGFVDWNADGDFDDADEAISQTIATGAANQAVTLSFTPAAIAANINFGARFRLSTDPNLGPDGPATNGEVEDYILVYAPPPPPVEFDWSDLPDSLSIPGTVDYNTDKVGIEGPSHQIIPELRIGAAIDAELDGQPSAQANGDDDNPATLDDEDGVVLPSLLLEGAPNNFMVTVSNTTGAAAYLYGFVDWNADGVFTGASERVSQTIPTGSVNSAITLALTPSAITKDVTFGARFRLSTDPNLGADGSASNGEVEDYILNVPTVPTDWGDLPDENNPIFPKQYNTDKNGVEGPSHPIIPGLKIGKEVDAELDGQPDDEALGDDKAGNTPDDEDGVMLPEPTLGRANDFVVTVSNTTTQEAFLVGFVDWNADRDFDDANEQIQVTVPAGTVDEAIILTLTPADIKPFTNFGVRFRLSTDRNLGPGGPATNGEVEDYLLINIPDIAPEYDRGDLPQPPYATKLGATEAISGPSHLIVSGLYLGEGVDSEEDGIPHVQALGDDNDGSIDDEDGVELPDKIWIGGTAEIRVTAVNTTPVNAYLTGFVDWNMDGDFDDQSETLTQTVPRTTTSTPQPFIFSFDVPTTTVISTHPITNHLGVRFRLSTTPNLEAFDRQGDVIPDGEVEDYLIHVVAYDRGDLPEPKYTTMVGRSRDVMGPSHLIVADLHLGERVDGEGDGQPHHFANGDDGSFLSDHDDEDGVLLPRLIEISSPGEGGEKTATFAVKAVNGRGINAYLAAFVDWNGDGDFEDTDETKRVTVPPTADNATQEFELTFVVPYTTLTSTTGNLNDLGVRFRLSTTPDLKAYDNPSDPMPDGEVEDYLIPAETAVTLASFNATQSAPGRVVLNWVTLTEIANIGFRIYRSTEDTFTPKDYLKSVPSQSSNERGDGATYTIKDGPDEAGVYNYWLVAIDSGGNFTEYPPQTVNVLPFSRIFLPTMTRNE